MSLSSCAYHVREAAYTPTPGKEVHVSQQIKNLAVSALEDEQAPTLLRVRRAFRYLVDDPITSSWS